MADKDQQVYPLPQSNGGDAKHDEESASSIESQDLRKNKRMKYLAYFVAFAVFQTGIILLFALTIMKVRTPKFRVRSATFENFEVGTTAIPAFNLRMNAELGVKNTNFGDYKFQNSTIYFFYDGAPVGEAVVPKSKAGIRATKKFNVIVDLSSSNLPSNSPLGNDLSSGVLTFKSQSKLSGKVELMKVLKKKKSTDMDCSITIGVADKVIQQINCK